MEMQEQEYGSEQKQQWMNALQKLGLLVVLFILLIAGVVMLSRQGQNNTQPCDAAANGVYNYQQTTYTIGVVAQNYRASYNNGESTTANFDGASSTPCLCGTGANGGYNYQQTAYMMGLAAQSKRAGLYGGKGTSANLGGATITLCPANGGKEDSKPSPLYEGYNYSGKDYPKNFTHSEQQAYRWVIGKLKPARFQAGDHVYVTIYSEVPVCTLCKADMVVWNADFQALLLGSVKVQTQVWQMRRGSPAAVGQDPVPDDKKKQGFVSGKFPAGTGFPLQYGDVEMVPISFR